MLELKPEVISQSELMSRGWTKSLIEKFLPEPDKTKQNPRFRSAGPVKLFSLQRVQDTEASAAFIEAKFRLQRGRAVAKRTKKTSRKRHRCNPSSAPLSAEALRMRVAVHEAGHAVLACLLRQPFQYVSIKPDGLRRGQLKLDMSNIGPRDAFVEQSDGKFRFNQPRVSPERTLEKYTLIVAAGPVAESMYQGLHVVTEDAWKHHRACAVNLALSVFGNSETADAYVDLVSARVQWIILKEPVFRAVGHVAAALLECNLLSSRKVRTIVREILRGDTTYKELVKHVPFKSDLGTQPAP